jgi:UDP-glucose 4-epimerase
MAMGRKVMVCGGAGYIGAHMCEQLAADGHGVVVFDSLEGGKATQAQWGELVVGDLRDPTALDAVFSRHRFDAVMHFAGRIVVSESVREPALYYDHNVVGTLNLLRAAVAHGVPPVVFSSTAAVYGDPQYTPIDEAHPCAPVNPYGRTKLIVERMLSDFRAACGLRSVSLRYFNAAGASASGRIGETHEPETHLIPNVLRAAREGRAVDVFGADYPTPDGSCVRDYIHVVDVCRAHLAALDHVWRDGDSVAVNLGTGQGHSVREVIAVAERVCGRPIARRVCPRRAGDPPVLVASARKAQEVLDWHATQSDLPAIIESAWAWEGRR